MTKGLPLGLILKFTFPLFVGNLFQHLYNMVDSIIVGRYLGPDALAAIGSVSSIIFFVIGFLQGFTAGLTVITSQRFGAGDYSSMKKSIAMAYRLSAAGALITTLLSCVYLGQVLKLMQTPANIMEMAHSYCFVIFLGIWATVLYNLTASLLRSVGNSRIPLFFLVLSSALNVILDLLFVAVFPFGVAGAAWATVISQGLSGILSVIYIRKKVRLLCTGLSDWTFDSHICALELKISLPMAFQFSITAIGVIIIQSALNLLGSTAVAAYTIASKIEKIADQFYLSLGMTMATYGGQNMGAALHDRIKHGVRTSLVLSAVYSFVIYFVILFIHPHVVRLFISEHVAEITSYVTTYVIFIPAFFMPLAMIYIFRNVLQGCGFSMLPFSGGILELICRITVAAFAISRRSYTIVLLGHICAWSMAGIYLCLGYLYIFGRIRRRKEQLQAVLPSAASRTR